MRVESALLAGYLAYNRGEARSRFRVHVPEQIDVKAIRRRLRMTQEEFSARFGFSVNTLRHWEHGKRQPEGPTRAYLMIAIARSGRGLQSGAQRVRLGGRCGPVGVRSRLPGTTV